VLKKLIFITILGLSFIVGLHRIGYAEGSNTLPIKKSFSLSEKFMRAFTTIKKSYVDEINEDELIDAAIEGMLSKLDPYSSYLTPEHQTNLLKNLNSQTTGFGIAGTLEYGQVKISHVFSGSPAAISGLKVDDIIVKIDGYTTRHMTIDEVSDRLHANKGSKIRLGFTRGKVKKVQEVILTATDTTVLSVRNQTYIE